MFYYFDLLYQNMPKVIKIDTSLKKIIDVFGFIRLDSDVKSRYNDYFFNNERGEESAIKFIETRNEIITNDGIKEGYSWIETTERDNFEKELFETNNV